MKPYKLLLCITVFIAGTFSYTLSAQTRLDSILNKLDPDRLAASISKKADKLEDRILQKSEKVLTKLQKQEEKVYEKMLKDKDSLLAKAKLEELRSKYTALREKIKTPVTGGKANYVPQLDSLATTLKFLGSNNITGKVSEALGKTQSLQGKFDQAEEVRRFISGRKQQLKEQFEKLGMVKELKQVNKQVYYYSAQIKEYKEILKDPKKIEKKALALLSQVKPWRDFFRKNSLLASLFRIQDPDEPLTMASIAGLQTRAQVQALVQDQIRNAGPNGAQIFQQQMASAQGQLKSLQNKILKGGGGSSDDIMPEGFKPNNQKTKSFLQRLEYGTNLQTQKGNSYWPNSADLALSVGYKLGEGSIIGIGASYNLSLGRGWNAIRFSSEGVGLRSFIDWKVKKMFWLTGGFEMNYRTAFTSLVQLQNFNAWQQSGLIGVSKTVPIKSKFFEKTKVQILWDMLARRQVPRGQNFVFRVGYSFKSK